MLNNFVPFETIVIGCDSFKVYVGLYWPIENF